MRPSRPCSLNASHSWRHRIHVIEHGHWPRRVSPHPAAKAGRSEFHVAIIGGLERHKGLEVLKRVLALNDQENIVFHLYGSCPDPVLSSSPPNSRTRVGRSWFVFHGPYESSQIVDRLSEDAIDVGFQPAIWPETFSYTLSEFVQAGIPVVVGDMGALADRTRGYRLGWVVDDIRNERAVVELLHALSTDRSRVARVAEEMDVAGALGTMDRMWRTYLSYYRDCVQGRPHASQDATLEMTAYVALMAKELSTSAKPMAEAYRALTAADHELARLRELLQSPRHRVADRLAEMLRAVPIIWPAIAAVTDRYVSRKSRQ